MMDRSTDRALLAVAPVHPDMRAEDAASRILEQLLAGFPGPLAIRLWTGRELHLGAGDPAFTLVLRDPRALAELVLRRDPLLLVDAYVAGRIDVEGDLEAALALGDHFGAIEQGAGRALRLGWDAVQLAAATGARGSHSALRAAAGLVRNAHTQASDREAVRYHYDVSNEFYRLWLDAEMVYSCAYFERGDETIDEAQRAKLDHICRKLRLAPGERLLDIGCGWGALVRHAAHRYGVSASGVTVSAAQLEHAQTRIAADGLGERCRVELCDYRDIHRAARFDKIVSVGMFEHVGLRNFPAYFGAVERLLERGGLFLNHGITRAGEGWPDTPDTRFINRYIFPGGELDSVGNVTRAMERAGLEILDVEALRPHYALTLRRWVERLERRRDAARALVPEAVVRLWRLYMLACAREFEAGSIGVYQILAARRGALPADFPLTRTHLCPGHAGSHHGADR